MRLSVSSNPNKAIGSLINSGIFSIEYRMQYFPDEICKSDLSDGAAAFALAGEYGVEAIGVSAVTGEGVGALIDRIAELIAPECESALVTNSRHIAALRECSAALSSALQTEEADCIATDLRSALIALGEITGKSVDADVVDRIFSRFCVGK